MQEQAQEPEQVDQPDQQQVEPDQPQPDQSQLSFSELVTQKQKELEGGGEESKDAPEEKKDEAAKEPEKPKLDPAPKASHWASLRRREQHLVEKQQAWQQEREQQLAQLKEWEDLKSRAKDDPFAALRAIGHEDGKAFLEMIAQTGGQMTPEQKRIWQLEKDNQEMRKLREESESKLQQEAQQRQIQHNIDTWHQSISQYIKSTPEFADSLANVPGIEGAVFDVMQNHYKETNGEQMEYHDAVKVVEQHLETKLSGMLNELVSNKRGLAMFQEIASKINKPAQASKKAPQGITQRITNNTGARKTKPQRFDDKLANAASWLNDQFG